MMSSVWSVGVSAEFVNEASQSDGKAHELPEHSKFSVEQMVIIGVCV